MTEILSNNAAVILLLPIAAKVAELEAIQAYQSKRVVGTATTSGYNTITEQLDQLYHDINAGKFGSDAKTGEWFVGITSVKTAFPKSPK